MTIKDLIQPFSEVHVPDGIEYGSSTNTKEAADKIWELAPIFHLEVTIRHDFPTDGLHCILLKAKNNQRNAPDFNGFMQVLSNIPLSETEGFQGRETKSFQTLKRTYGVPIMEPVEKRAWTLSELTKFGPRFPDQNGQSLCHNVYTNSLEVADLIQSLAFGLGCHSADCIPYEPEDFEFKVLIKSEHPGALDQLQRMCEHMFIRKAEEKPNRFARMMDHVDHLVQRYHTPTGMEMLEMALLELTGFPAGSIRYSPEKPTEEDPDKCGFLLPKTPGYTRLRQGQLNDMRQLRIGHLDANKKRPV